MSAAFSDKYYEVVIEAPLEIIRVRRSTKRFESISVVRLSSEAMLTVLRSLSASRTYHGLLYDSRNASPFNLPEIENAVVASTKAMLTLFPRVAILVRTAQSALQIERSLKAIDLPGSAFHIEDEALASLSAKHR